MPQLSCCATPNSKGCRWSLGYPIASVLLHEQNNLTLAVGSKLFLYEQKYLWGDFAAAAILSGLPITAVFLLAQKWMISGLTAGGVKG